MALFITKSLAVSPSLGLSRSRILRWSVRAMASSSEARPWAELEKWRVLDVDTRRSWVDGVAVSLADGNDPADPLDLPQSLESCGALVLKTADPLEKARITHAAYRALRYGTLPDDSPSSCTRCRQGRVSRGNGATAPEMPARLPRPPLAKPKDMPTLATTPLPKTVFLLHNLAHIELNAVDLAWDTLVRTHGSLDPLPFNRCLVGPIFASQTAGGVFWRLCSRRRRRESAFLLVRPASTVRASV